jgi:hypothetical protein
MLRLPHKDRLLCKCCYVVTSTCCVCMLQHELPEVHVLSQLGSLVLVLMMLLSVD